MVKRKRWSKDLHHRVPDFKLVYCGSKKNTAKKEPRHDDRKRVVEVSVTAEGNNAAVKDLEKPRQIGKG